MICVAQMSTARWKAALAVGVNPVYVTIKVAVGAFAL
jgi:hypothetical protein